MRRGRKPSVAGLVERLDGAEETKRRLALILETLTGQRSVAEVGHQLGLSARRLYELRLQVMQDALDGLQPRPPGRPGQRADESSDPRAEELQRLRVELKAAQVREEIALALPHLLRRRRPARATPRKRPRRR
jgi:transposase-like protein